MNAPLRAAPERIWLAVEAVDMRVGIDGLSARIQASLVAAILKTVQT